MVIFIILSFVAVVAFLNVLISKFLHLAPVSRVLYLREISDPSTMLTLPSQAHENVFAEEFMLLFEYAALDLDYAVMKHVANDVPMLSKQEQKHAVLHHSAIKLRKSNGEHASFWRITLKILQILLLRSGRMIGAALAAHLEAGSISWAFFVCCFPFVKKGLITHF